MAEYTLYWGPKMGSAAVQAALIWADLPHQLVQVNFGNSEHKTAKYRAINPAGKIPALRLPDGTVLSESGAMMVYLSDLVPERGLLPGVTAVARAEACGGCFYLPVKRIQRCFAPITLRILSTAKQPNKAFLTKRRQPLIG